ncbi:MAG: hypothetical protein QGG19_10000 [Alphaproteobacteria bacterium]|nr:hypothetical protein [Alphaproteobacteria bacterium]MDP6255552.1 hypothetical protein [Alphaproteobacteria bacterium]MDP7056280.1 hypothetical protein [Alphaproteobacteria bacterium]MDP7228316.1 hypothetical protein [Alphaproteobacteria bacterium]MDP7460860.1 hypothetical protein [Alphaproteobacteria bacterium]
MPFFKLTPINTADPNWLPSSHKDICVARTGSEELARNMAQLAFTMPTMHVQGTQVRVMVWRNPDKVTSQTITDGDYEADGPSRIPFPKNVPLEEYGAVLKAAGKT